MYQRHEKIYEGKAKTLYTVSQKPEYLYQEFKNSLTAFNGVKKGSFETKGSVNRDISSMIFRYLQKQGVAHHWIADQDQNAMIVRKLKIIPLEVVVRNKAAGSLAKRFGWEEGRPLSTPLVELYYKDDALGDPIINDEHVLLLQACTLKELEQLKSTGRLINTHLIELFLKIGLDLIDFKLEFGRSQDGQILLADEITPDGCRLWDKNTNEKMDKDRFRRDLGNVQETYEEVLKRLKNTIGSLV